MFKKIFWSRMSSKGGFVRIRADKGFRESEISEIYFGIRYRNDVIISCDRKEILV